MSASASSSMTGFVVPNFSEVATPTPTAGRKRRASTGDGTREANKPAKTPKTGSAKSKKLKVNPGVEETLAEGQEPMVVEEEGEEEEVKEMVRELTVWEVYDMLM